MKVHVSTDYASCPALSASPTTPLSTAAVPGNEGITTALTGMSEANPAVRSSASASAHVTAFPHLLDAVLFRAGTARYSTHTATTSPRRDVLSPLVKGVLRASPNRSNQTNGCDTGPAQTHPCLTVRSPLQSGGDT